MAIEVTKSWSSDGYNGLLDWLGKDKDTTTWAHPETSRAYVSTSSSTTYNGEVSSRAIDQDNGTRMGAGPAPGTWWMIDFGDSNSVVCTRFGIRGQPNLSQSNLEWWHIQGSTDGEHWVEIYESNGYVVSRATWHSFAITDDTPYRYFRIRGTRHNFTAANTEYILIGGVEIWGEYHDTAATAPETDVFAAGSGEGWSGVFEWLGQNKSSSAWEHPETSRSLVSTEVSAAYAAGRDSDKAIDHSYTASEDTLTTDVAGSWWKVDFGSGNTFQMDAFAICASDDKYPRNVRMEGSNNGSDWTEIYDVPDGTTGPQNNYEWHLYTVTDEAGDTPYRYFRLVQYGQNGDSTDYLAIGSIEFYGEYNPTPATPEQTVPAEQYWPPDGIFRFQVELGLATATGTDVWDTGEWGTATWAATSPVYVDVTEHVLGFTCKYGRARFDERMKTGNARITFDNAEGWFNPDAGEDFNESLALRPGRWIRLSAVRDTDDAQWDLWEGYVYSIEERYTNGGSDSITVVDAFDFAGLMAQHDEPAQSAAGSGELSGARVHRVLDEFGPVDGGWPWRDVAGGLHTMQSTTLAQNLLEEAQRAADADNGAFFFRNRYATFRPFDWLTNQEYERSQEVQLYPGRGSTGDPEIIDAETEWTAQVIRNDVQMSRDGGSAQRSQDTTSQGIYGRHSWHRLDLQNDTDADVSDIADAILAAYAYDYQRLKAVTIVPTTGSTTPDLIAVTSMLDMRLGDLVSVDVDLGPRGWSYTTEAHVMGIQFDVAPAFWSMTLRLDQSVRGNPEESS